MMILEILSIAIVNYYTSSPDVLKPSHGQIQQVKNLLAFIQQNYLGVVEIILAKLPSELVQNQFVSQLQTIAKNKKQKKKQTNEHFQMSLTQSNEHIINLLRGIIRQGQQAGAGANMSAKRMAQMRSQGLLKSAMVTGAALRPLYSTIGRSLKSID